MNRWKDFPVNAALVIVLLLVIIATGISLEGLSHCQRHDFACRWKWSAASVYFGLLTFCVAFITVGLFRQDSKERMEKQK